MSAFDDFETGPIRPPSEAGSFLLRVTRGCPWNRCTFCRTYKRRKFEIRPLGEVKADIDAMARVRDRLRAGEDPRSREAWQVANALAHGGGTAFLQDGDSLAAKPDHIRALLAHFRDRFPEVTRITTYARSRTLASRAVADLASYRELGLTRIHVGMETGHDPLLKLVEKGVTAEIHVKGGRRVVEAGIELSEYVMPGLGGREMSEGHARDTARALNAIQPHFIRLRTLCLGPKLPLAANFGPGGLTRQDDAETVEEIRRFVEALEMERTTLASDHILNLLGDLTGRLPEEKPTLLAIIDAFLSLPREERLLFQAGRRAGLLESTADLARPELRARSAAVLREIEHHFGPEKVEEGIFSLMERFV